MDHINNLGIKDHFTELYHTLMKTSKSILKEIGTKFKLTKVAKLKKKELVINIINRIEEVMKAKYQPKTPEEFKKISKMVLNSILPQLSKTAQNTKTSFISSKKKFLDPLEELMLKNLTNCVCWGNYKRNDNLLIKCSRGDCEAVFHHGCIPWPLKDLNNFECPRCIILNNDPLNKVEKILYEPSILRSEQGFSYKLSFNQFSKINSSPDYGVEIRTLKLDGVHFFEQTWPDKCVIKVNSKTIKEVKPLHHNSSLKKRRDEKIFNRHMSKMGVNVLNVIYNNVVDGKNTKQGENPKYVFAILFVRKLTVPMLQEIVLRENKMGIEQSKAFIRSKFANQKDVEISEIKVDLLCKITYTMVKYPARGVNCDHIDCFNLKFFLQTMEKNAVRKWICPLCRKRCSKIVVDSYIEQILEGIEEKGDAYEKLFFRKDASYVFVSSHAEIMQQEEQEGKVETGKVKHGENERLNKKDKEVGKGKDGEIDFEVLSILSSDDDPAPAPVAKKVVRNEPSLALRASDKKKSKAVMEPEPLYLSKPIEPLKFDNSLANTSPSSQNSIPSASPETQPTPLRPPLPMPTHEDIPNPTQPERSQEQEDKERPPLSPKKISNQMIESENIDINLDEYSPITIHNPALVSGRKFLQSSSRIPHNVPLLGKRSAPALDAEINAKLMEDRKFTSNYSFIKKFYSSYINDKKSEKGEIGGYFNYKKSLENFLAEDRKFEKRLDLLHKFVRNRKREYRNPKILKRYRDMLRGVHEQNWIYNDKNVMSLPQKRVKRRARDDNGLFKGILKHYQFDDPEDIGLIGLKGKTVGLGISLKGNSLDSAIEIL